MRFREPIDTERRDAIVEGIAKRVQQFGMLVPAIFFLEMNKPLSYIGGQAMHFFAPFVGVFFSTFEDYAYFFDNRANVELLIRRLEDLAAEEEEADRKAKKKKKAQKGSLLDEAMQLEKNAKESRENSKDFGPHKGI